MGLWGELPSRALILAPMEDVTDTVFRTIISSCGRPDVMYTEFTNCEGLQSEYGRTKVIHRLKYTESERPLVAQIWGITPEDYYKSAQQITEMGFDGIDINLGCPVKKVIKMGACSALIQDPQRAKEIITATQEGAASIPVSVKTRIGFNHIQTEEWCGFLLEECNLAALVVHGRTVKEESRVPNHWDQIGKVVELRNAIQKNISSEFRTKIIGNGDIISYIQAQELISQYGMDGAMIGRGVFHNPWIFNPEYSDEDGVIAYRGQSVSLEERLQLLIRHVVLWDEVWGNTKHFPQLKKYFKIYIQGFDNASVIRQQLMECNSVNEVISTANSLINSIV